MVETLSDDSEGYDDESSDGEKETFPKRTWILIACAVVIVLGGVIAAVVVLLNPKLNPLSQLLGGDDVDICSCQNGCAAKQRRRLVETMPHATFSSIDADCAEKTMAKKNLPSVQSSSFNQYQVPASYANPLSNESHMEKTVADSEITETLVMGYLEKLTTSPSASQPTRQTEQTDAMAKASDYLQSVVNSLGIQTCIQNFEGESKKGEKIKAKNVIGYIEGSVDGSVVIGAHYDDQSDNPGVAPGANDDGSGSAALLGVAKAFANDDIKSRIKKSVYFVWFGAEEQGLVGSTFFADDLKNGGGNLPAECRPASGFSPAANHLMIAMDMVGFKSPKFTIPTLMLEGCTWSSMIVNHVASASKHINADGLHVGNLGNPFGSDHIPFLKRGIPAILVIAADEDSFMPYYHTDKDVIILINGDQLAKVAKMVFGGAFRMAVT